MLFPTCQTLAWCAPLVRFSLPVTPVSVLHLHLQSLQHENQRLLAGKLQSSKMLDAAARAKEGLQAELAAARKVSNEQRCVCCGPMTA